VKKGCNEEIKESVLLKDNPKQNITNKKLRDGCPNADKSLLLNQESTGQCSILYPKAQVKSEVRGQSLFKTNMKHAVIAYYIYFGYKADKGINH